MTRKACELIVHIGTICLAWRSIKTLKRPSNKMNVEVLQLWSLLALHNVFTRFGFECFICWFPFYYYFKMIVLVVTFIPGAKFPNFWFETLLVPAIEKIHQCLEFDWISWTRRHATLFPFILIDFVFIPGLLSSEQASTARQRRMEPTTKPIITRLDQTTITQLENQPIQQQQDKPSLVKRNVSLEHLSIIAQSRRNLRRFSRDHQHCDKHFYNQNIAMPLKKTVTCSTVSPSQSITSNSNMTHSSSTIYTSSDSEISIQSHDNDTSMQFVSSIGGDIPMDSVLNEDSTSQSSKKKVTNVKKIDQMNNYDSNDADDEVSSYTANQSRKSLSHNLRHILTGDPNLRVRDHLFNLSVPTSPSPRKRERERDFCDKRRKRHTSINASPKRNNDICSETRRKNWDSDYTYTRTKESKLSTLLKRDDKNSVDNTTASTVPNFIGNTRPVSDAIFMHMDQNITTRRRRSPRQIAKQEWQKRQSLKRFLSNEIQSTHTT